jgi:hypothetical protein
MLTPDRAKDSENGHCERLCIPGETRHIMWPAFCLEIARPKPVSPITLTPITPNASLQRT